MVSQGRVGWLISEEFATKSCPIDLVKGLCVLGLTLIMGSDLEDPQLMYDRTISYRDSDMMDMMDKSRDVTISHKFQTTSAKQTTNVDL